MTSGPSPAELDLGTVALLAGQAAAAVVQRDLEEAGFGDVRFSHGYLFQHLVDGDPTISDLAARLDITQQGASKAITELERAGYAERFGDPVDLRIRRVRLTDRGRAVVEASRSARRRLAEHLAERHGAERIDAARTLLAEILTGLGGAEAVRQRDVRPPV